MRGSEREEEETSGIPARSRGARWPCQGWAAGARGLPMGQRPGTLLRVTAGAVVAGWISEAGLEADRSAEMRQAGRRSGAQGSRTGGGKLRLASVQPSTQPEAGRARAKAGYSQDKELIKRPKRQHPKSTGQNSPRAGDSVIFMLLSPPCYQETIGPV